MTRTVSRSAAETEAAGAALAARLTGGDVVLLDGELGAGKTTFVRGALRALGSAEPVTSPTFTLGARHGRASHLDLYRLAGAEDEDPGLLDDYFGPDLIAFVEWPERASGLLPPAAWRVTLAHGATPRERLIDVERL